MKKLLLTIFSLTLTIASFGQWTALITDAAGDNWDQMTMQTGGMDGTLLEWQYDATNDDVLFRITCPNLATYANSPSADFHFFLPNGIESGNPTGNHWSTTTQTHKSAYSYTDVSGTPPSTYSYTSGYEAIQETNGGMGAPILCPSSCVGLYVDVPNNYIIYTFDRAAIITDIEMGGSQTATIGLVVNVGYDFAWNDAITHTSMGASSVTFDLDLGGGAPQILVNNITVDGQGSVTTIVAPGGTLQMVASVTPANADDQSVAWSVTNQTGTATIDLNGVLSAVTNGTVNVTATANDASGVSGSVVVTISNQDLGLEDTDNIVISIQPNPVKNLLHIKGNIAIESVVLFDITGKQVLTVSDSFNNVNVSQLENGVYFVLIIGENNTFVKQAQVIKI